MYSPIQETFVRKTLREQMADILRSRILRMEIAPGERIIEEEISRQYQVSRGPVREALRQLEEEGIITYIPHKGCVVKTLSHRDMQEVYMIRSTLECLAVRICSGRLTPFGVNRCRQTIEQMEQAGREKDLCSLIEADEKFHSILVEETGCEKLFKIWKQLQGGNTATYYTMDSEGLMPYDFVGENHRKILSLFEQGADAKAIEEAIYAHYMIVPETLYRKQCSERGE